MTRTPIACVGLVGTLLLAPSVASAQLAAGYERVAEAPTSWRTEVQRGRLVATVEELTGHRDLTDGARLISRSIHHPHHATAAAHLLAEMERALPGRAEVRVEVFDGAGETGLTNIVGDLPALESPDPGADPVEEGLVVIGAHFDSTASLDPSEDWDPAVDPAPGADDDASGVAAVLEAARILGAWEPGFTRPLRFVLFDAEEVGLLGSIEHVARLGEAGEEAALALVLDPVGYDPGSSNVLWFLYDPRWPELSGEVEALVEPARSALEVRGLDGSLLGGQARRSDHAAFWDAGSPALHFGTFPPPPTYHTRADDLEVVNFDFLAEVTAFATALAAREAGIRDEVRPVGTACEGCAAASATPRFALLLLPLLALAARRRRNCR